MIWLAFWVTALWISTTLWAWALQAGVDYQFSDNLLVNFAIWHMDIDTTANYGFNGTSLTADVSIDPTAYTLSIGLRF